MPGARVTRVLLSPGAAADGGTASRRTRLDRSATGEPAADGRTRRLVVRAPKSSSLAAGALRTPAILQASALEHPAIGRNLRLHPVPVIAGLFPQPIDMWRGTMQAARSLEFAEPGHGNNGYVIESAPGHPGLLALALPGKAPMPTPTSCSGRGASGRSSPSPATAATGRTTLTEGGHASGSTTGSMAAALPRCATHSSRWRAWRERPGRPRSSRSGRRPPGTVAPGSPPAARRRPSPASRPTLASFDFRPNRGTVFSAHQMGTVRMGAGPARRIPATPWGRVRRDDRRDRAVRGLYVADGSLFPTGLGVNPMITIMVLARRVSRTILAEG